MRSVKWQHFFEVLRRYLETWINGFLRRLKEGHSRFPEFKKLEIVEKKLMSVRTQLQILNEFHSARFLKREFYCQDEKLLETVV